MVLCHAEGPECENGDGVDAFDFHVQARQGNREDRFERLFANRRPLPHLVPPRM